MKLLDDRAHSRLAPIARDGLERAVEERFDMRAAKRVAGEIAERATENVALVRGDLAVGGHHQVHRFAERAVLRLHVKELDRLRRRARRWNDGRAAPALTKLIAEARESGVGEPDHRSAIVSSRLAGGQRDTEEAPFAGNAAALAHHRAAVALDDSPHDVEAQAEASVVNRRDGAPETLEDLGELVARNADPVVAHLDDRRAALRADGDVDGP